MEKPNFKQYSVELILTVFIVLLLIGTVLYFYFESRTIGGKAIATFDEARSMVEQLVDRHPLLEHFADGSKACVIVPSGDDQHYSFGLRREGGTTHIIPYSELQCEGEQGEDFIIKYVDFTSLRTHAKNPTCKIFVAGGRGKHYWYWPSRLWPKGDRPLCNAEFQQKYCPGIYRCIDPRNVPGNVLDCCREDMLNQPLVDLARKAASAGLRHNDRVRDVSSVP